MYTSLYTYFKNTYYTPLHSTPLHSTILVLVVLNLIQNKKTFMGCTDECIDQVTFNSQLENYIKEPCLKSLKILSLVEKQLQQISNPRKLARKYVYFKVLQRSSARNVRRGTFCFLRLFQLFASTSCYSPASNFSSPEKKKNLAERGRLQ